MQLVIGNKNYSSWSMRPWVLMRGLNLPFEEIRLSFTLGLEGPNARFNEAVRRYSPVGKVPVLIDGDLHVWDSLAIAEYLAERYPQAGVWPADSASRARARSNCAEMHGGFTALRSHCPMNIEASLPEVGARVLREQPAVGRDLARIDAIWSEALASSGGPFLFAGFGAIDAYFAPVALRARTYALPMSPAAEAYAQRLLAHPACAAWIADGLNEHEWVPEDEPYRTKR
jgi:glutathione S-transferase